jgi:hypothetical protein
MRNSLVVALIVAACSACGLAASGAAAAGTGADSFYADAGATGTVVLWFLGQEVTADVRADVTISGTLLVNGVATSFSVTANAAGSGTGNLNSLTVDAWVIFDGQGKTESELPLTITGGMSVDALDPATTSTSGQGRGHFYFLIAAPDGRWIVEGDAVGGASGSFVVPDDPLTMQMTGFGSFTLSGEPRAWTPAENVAFPDWPTRLLAELERQLAAAEDKPAK